MKLALALALVAILVVGSYAECPNDCNGHGKCNVYSSCQCYRNWMGADCSERVCYFGHAFIDTPQGDLNSDGVHSATMDAAGDEVNRVTTQWTNLPTWETYDLDAHGRGRKAVASWGYGIAAGAAIASGGATALMHADDSKWDEAHFYRECSNKGICDRSSGLCQCFPSYEGEGCTRTVCPNECSGHGTCRRLKDQNSLYEAWDAYKTQHCVCDPGFMGPDCSLRVCPSGDDPISRIQADEVQVLAFAPGQQTDGSSWAQHADDKTLAADFHGLFALKFKDEFEDYWTTSALSWPSPPFDSNGLCNGTVGFGGATFNLRWGNKEKHYADSINTADGSAKTETGAWGSYPCSVATKAEVKAALEALPNDVIPEVSVDFKWNNPTPFGTAAAQDQTTGWAYLITFTGNSGNVNPLEVLYDVTQCISASGCSVTGSANGATGTPPTAVRYTSSYIDARDTIGAPAGAACGSATTCGAKAKSTAGLLSTMRGWPHLYSDSVAASTQWQHTAKLGIGTAGADDDVLGFDTTVAASPSYTTLKENALCSNRGLCDYSTGTCKCFKGYTAHDCSLQNALSTA